MILKSFQQISKGAIKEVTNTINISDVSYLNDNIENNNKLRSESSSFIAQSGEEKYLIIDEDLGAAADLKRRLVDFDTSISGTTYSLSGPGAEFVEIDSNGVLSFKSDQNFLVSENGEEIPGTVILNVNATIPNEGIETKQYKLVPKCRKS